jgi:hypothetical protein
MTEKKSVGAMIKDGGLKAYTYREVAEQFNNLIKKIKLIIKSNE